MKNLKFIGLVLFTSLFTVSCSNDDDNPAPVNEEEIITTIDITLTPQSGGDAVVLQSRDLDGDGPNPPVITVSESLQANTIYDGSISFLNETINPAEDITEEVEEEAEEHQVLFVVGNGLNAALTYENFDSNGNKLGTLFTLETGATSTGNLTFVLRHEPNKPNDGTLSGAGGETDATATFTVVIE